MTSTGLQFLEAELNVFVSEIMDLFTIYIILEFEFDTQYILLADLTQLERLHILTEQTEAC